MENEKPTYEQVEQELNEYKELLWQLSDEYKENLGNAEKQIEIERQKFKVLEQSISSQQSEPTGDYLSLLGLPACILDNDGNIQKHNNKFKFLVELIGFEIEDVKNISVLFNKSNQKDIKDRFTGYLSSDEGLLQSLFRTQNQFQGLINLIVRVYRHENEQEHLALFVELNANEVQNICSDNKTNLPEKDVENRKAEDIQSGDLIEIKADIAIFAEKYELLEEISKMPEFSASKSEISLTILQSLKRTFNLENSRTKIVEKLQVIYKSFLLQINQKYPELTTNEEKHCMLIKAGLTYKEIAAIMSVSINGVKIARNRLRKKFDLENETKTSDFIDNIN
jgi:DNA-binding CsgD family transcriptional regulator